MLIEGDPSTLDCLIENLGAPRSGVAPRAEKPIEVQAAMKVDAQQLRGVGSTASAGRITSSSRHTTVGAEADRGAFAGDGDRDAIVGPLEVAHTDLEGQARNRRRFPGIVVTILR